MKNGVVSSLPLPEFYLWNNEDRIERELFSITLEITARCNNDCRHCYINLPAADPVATSNELSLDEIKTLVDEAASLGALWCLVTGGEPLLRPDFADIYLYLKKKGFLVSVFTNATLIRPRHTDLFVKYPPRNLEVSVYGVTRETYERVTRNPGSFDAFSRGLALLEENRIPVNLKAMALRSNRDELPEIAAFCRRHSHTPFRFDPTLHLRYDRDQDRNAGIVAERLSPQEAVALELADKDRFEAMQRDCDNLIVPAFSENRGSELFRCGAGLYECVVGHDGRLRVCSSLWHPDHLYDLRKGSLKDAWTAFVPEIRKTTSDREAFLEGCRVCPIVNLCASCPAHAYLETGRMDTVVEYFCQVARARETALAAGNVS